MSHSCYPPKQGLQLPAESWQKGGCVCACVVSVKHLGSLGVRESGWTRPGARSKGSCIDRLSHFSSHTSSGPHLLHTHLLKAPPIPSDAGFPVQGLGAHTEALPGRWWLCSRSLKYRVSEGRKKGPLGQINLEKQAVRPSFFQGFPFSRGVRPWQGLSLQPFRDRMEVTQHLKTAESYSVS